MFSLSVMGDDGLLTCIGRGLGEAGTSIDFGFLTSVIVRVLEV